jgi:hypothetical protein
VNILLAHGASLLPTGGRDKLLAVLEMIQKAGSPAKVIFVCDQDLWVTFGRPPKYLDDRLLTTEGYSIENDILRDYDALALLNPTEAKSYEAELRLFLNWYSAQLEKYESSGAAEISMHVNHVLQFIKMNGELKGGERFNIWLSLVEANYRQIVRGKSLLALMVRQLSHSKRPVKHSALSILEHGAAAQGAHLRRLISSVADVSKRLYLDKGGPLGPPP